jgi:hypothetical protein
MGPLLLLWLPSALLWLMFCTACASWFAVLSRVDMLLHKHSSCCLQGETCISAALLQPVHHPQEIGNNTYFNVPPASPAQALPLLVHDWSLCPCCNSASAASIERTSVLSSASA